MAQVIALAGFMGSGKSTIGRKLARHLGWGFVDLDERVADSAGRGISELFADEGESGFRKRESETLRAVLSEDHGGGGLVLALGGGTIVDPENVVLLKEKALVVFLDVDAGTAWERVSGSERPLARDERAFRRLLDSRRHVYEAAADTTVKTAGRSRQAIVNTIVQYMSFSGEVRR